jgi:hypothetical protein
MIHEEHGSANSAPPPRDRTSRESSGSERNLTNADACAERARRAALDENDREKSKTTFQSRYRCCLAPCVLRSRERHASGSAVGVEARL